MFHTQIRITLILLLFLSVWDYSHSTLASASSSSSSSSPSSDHNKFSSYIYEAFILSLSGMLAIILLLILSYCCTRIWLCSQKRQHHRNSNNNNNDGSSNNNNNNNNIVSTTQGMDHYQSSRTNHLIDEGIVSRKAGLTGLRISERQLMLEHLLEQTSFQYFDPYNTNTDPSLPLDMKQDDHENKNDDNEIIVATAAECIDCSVIDKDKRMNDCDNIAEHDDMAGCAICLAPYQNNDLVWRGDQCQHVFHTLCALEWLQKCHDHCPYCRMEMISAQPTWLETASSVLSKDRVLEICQ